MTSVVIEFFVLGGYGYLASRAAGFGLSILLAGAAIAADDAELTFTDPAKAGPDYEKTITEVQSGLTIRVMQELDARVELEKETPKAAAKAYLESAGYIG